MIVDNFINENEVKAIAGNWYNCQLQSGVTGRRSVLYCPINNFINLPEEETFKWYQKDVTIVGIASISEVTPFKLETD